MTKIRLTQAVVKAREDLLNRIGYRFSNMSLFDEALLHPSAQSELRVSINNQRLEFLGDRVINLVVADMIFIDGEERPEGVMARFYIDCVENTAMAKIAHSLDLGKALVVQNNTALAETDKVLADALEALIGAIWRDGGIDPAYRVVRDLWKETMLEAGARGKDNKTRLQEHALAQYQVLPQYKMVGREGPDHAPIFTVEVMLEAMTAQGIGKSLRLAEHEAAKTILEDIDARLVEQERP